LPRTPILIAELPPLLRDIVIDTIADRPDMAVVGVVERGASIVGAVDRTGATVVIVGAVEAARLARTELLARVEGPGIVALTLDTRAAVVEVPLGHISPDRLVEAIRQVAAMRAVDPP
jgi:DNA-binding NarL/FixJ family response regulator